jgi:hypothetical protein
MTLLPTYWASSSSITLFIFILILFELLLGLFVLIIKFIWLPIIHLPTFLSEVRLVICILWLLMIKVRDSIRIRLEGTIIGSLILKSISSIKKSFIFRVAAWYYTKYTACIVIVWQCFSHYLIHEICNKV